MIFSCKQYTAAKGANDIHSGVFDNIYVRDIIYLGSNREGGHKNYDSLRKVVRWWRNTYHQSQISIAVESAEAEGSGTSRLGLRRDVDRVSRCRSYGASGLHDDRGNDAGRPCSDRLQEYDQEVMASKRADGRGPEHSFRPFMISIQNHNFIAIKYYF